MVTSHHVCKMMRNVTTNYKGEESKMKANAKRTVIMKMRMMVVAEVEEKRI